MDNKETNKIIAEYMGNVTPVPVNIDEVTCLRCRGIMK